MDLELTDQLRGLAEHLESFIDHMEDLVHNSAHDDNEYEFMEDESGISNTEMDNLVEILNQGLDLTNKLVLR
jgi:hypothetical protein